MNEKLLAEEIIKQISKIIKGNGALVGRDECMKIVWNDEEKRTSVNTFEKFKHQSPRYNLDRRMQDVKDL